MAGYRSLLAFWIGGAGALSAPSQAGYRSLLAFWAGGAATDGTITPPVVTPTEQTPAGRKKQYRQRIVIDDRLYEVTPDELAQIIELRARRIARGAKPLPKPVRKQVAETASPAERAQAYIGHVRQEVAGVQWALDAIGLVDVRSLIEDLNAATLRYLEAEAEDEEMFIYLLAMMV